MARASSWACAARITARKAARTGARIDKVRARETFDEARRRGASLKELRDAISGARGDEL